ncbi:NAD(P)/FAD-dependent oxidoreductase [Methanobacterium formicicum]|uniref:Phytoene dehydrogenase-related protein n=1 Tax=Methanobacterium formicicum (strain DSM 3637 / PP1) TaxID=1204725 RepID=K2QDF4_METFP|nr:phytoene desaturase family protein [Methanobacterium formicicum]EKF86061.1 phytoene dehydrogenase-related protein [Methanobacterium formicicum DSM 3637]
MKVLIVGAGFGGLSAAALLAKDGYQVTVIEKNEGPGGRASVYSDHGFYFDMGPSWYLMPDVFEHFYANFDLKPEDLFQLEKLDPSYRVFFDDTNIVDISSDLEKNYQLFDSLEEGGAEKLKEYLASAEELYDHSVKEMLYRDYTSVLDFLNGKLLLSGIRMNILENLEHYVNRKFSSDEARKIVQYSIGFLGSSPKKTPSLYHIMSHIDLTLGVWYPQGGIREVARTMMELAQTYGALFKFNEPVELLEVHEKHVKRVITSKEVYEPDIVIVNADYAHSELDLLTEENQTYDEDYWEKRVLAPSALVAYVGIDREMENLVHHNLFLDKDWAEGFDTLFDPKQAKWPENPSYYVNIPSKTDKTAAPPGSDTLFILVPLAPGIEDTTKKREQLYNKIMDDLETKTGENIRDHIVVKRIFALEDFKERYNAYKGTALGLSHTLMQTALFRPAHKSKKVENLYYSGQFTHPGIGVPMTLISSEIVAQEINQRYG